MPTERSLIGCLVGTAIGDALGLPHEGLSPRRARRLFPNVDRHHFLFGHGMFSDDTEHACMTAQSLLVSAGEPMKFAQSLAWRLRWWLLGCPPAVGKATLKACLKLCVGFRSTASGVFSAGNGPCMRAPSLGVALADRPDKLRQLISIGTRITHTDPKAEYGALAIALAAGISAEPRSQPLPPIEVANRITAELGEPAKALNDLIRQAAVSVAANQPTEAFAADLNLTRGVTGYVDHTVPVVIHAWLRFPDDYASAIRSVIRCGGDTDTIAAIAGGIIGARVGVEGIPEAWRTHLAEWPRNLRWVERLGRELAKGLADGRSRRSVPLNPIGVLARNVVFAGTVFAHVGRRMLPPY